MTQRFTRSYQKRLDSEILDKTLKKLLGWQSVMVWNAVGSAKNDEFEIYISIPWGGSGRAPSLMLNAAAFNNLLKDAGAIGPEERVVSIWLETPMADHLMQMQVEAP